MEPWILRQFHKYNKKYFNSSLPTPIIQVKPNLVDDDGDTALAMCSKQEGTFLLEFNSKLFLKDSLLRNLQKVTLVHEMVHMHLHPDTSHKNKLWKREVQRLADLGFLVEVF